MSYDALQRLSTVTRTTEVGQGGETSHSALHASYDALGNLRGKPSLMGVQRWLDYDLDARPNAVASEGQGGQTLHTYTYNANGAMTGKWDGTGQTLLQSYQWTPFNMPLVMTNHSAGATPTVSTFHYGAGRQRIQQYLARSSGETRQTKYVGGGIYEKVLIDPDGPGGSTPATTTERAYIGTPSGNVAVIIRETDASAQADTRVEYLHHDHQGSLVEVSSALGDIVASYSYDAWGAQRNPDTWHGLPPTGQTPEKADLYVGRSYTGHEPLQDFDLVHMNGRLYDASLGRFISADPFVQFPDK